MRIEHAAQEIARARMPWIAEHLGGGTRLADPAVVQEGDAIGDLARETHLVRDHDHRHAVGGQLTHHAEHLADQLGIERRGGLVEQDRARLHGQGPRDRCDG